MMTTSNSVRCWRDIPSHVPVGLGTLGKHSRGPGMAHQGYSGHMGSTHLLEVVSYSCKTWKDGSLLLLMQTRHCTETQIVKLCKRGHWQHIKDSNSSQYNETNCNKKLGCSTEEDISALLLKQ